MDDKIVYSYIDEIGKRLGEPNIYGAASLMIGAGFSKNADSLSGKKNTPPDWSQLAEVMFEEIYPFEKDNIERKSRECYGNNVLTLAQKYEVTFDRQALNSLIERKIADKLFVPGELHKSILELNWNDVFTTNYDTLLERAIEQIKTKQSYKIVYSQDDLPGSIRPRLVKLHGSIEHSGHYIITEEDYRTYPDKYAPFVNTVQQSMLETKLCLIGFSGSDPNFLNWLGWLRDNMGENCPTIYLCGVFDDIGTAERKMLEKRKITIVDLSVLVDENVENVHYAAIKRFIELLKENNNKKNEHILCEKPYANIDIWDNNSKVKIEEYKKAIEPVVTSLVESLEEYVCLPKEESKDIGSYIERQLQYIVKVDYFEEKCKLINAFCGILKVCNCPLYDNMAVQLEKIISDVRNRAISKINIYIYLLQMYRIDGKFDEYEKVNKYINIDSFESPRDKNEYWIEYAKFSLCKMDIKAVFKCIDKIDISYNDEYTLKKASLLNQIGRKEEAKEIVTSYIAFLSQQKYSENKNASLIGYANLVARATWSFYHEPDLFSDSLYEYNKYNTRKIVVESKESIIETFVENNRPENKRISAFNPNSYTVSYTMGSNNESKKRDASFYYLLLQDQLCIGIYRDHRTSTEVAVRMLESTSISPLWRWYQILRINDKKVYNSYFTRERIYNTDKVYVELFFDEVMEVLSDTILREKSIKYYFADCKHLIDIASRMTIVLDVQRIMDLISILVQLDEMHIDEYEKRAIIDNSLRCICYSFNAEILNGCMDYIINDKLISYRFASCFDEIDCMQMDCLTQDDKERVFKSIISQLESEDETIRNAAVVKYKLLKQQIYESEYKEEVLDKLYLHIDEFGFPKNKTYLPTAWRMEEKDFIGKIKKYLLNSIFLKSYDSGVISDNDVTDEQIFAYVTILYQTLGDVQYEECELSKIICNLRAYLINESNIVKDKFDIFGRVSQAIERLDRITKIVLLICLYAHKNNKLSDVLLNEIRGYLDAAEEIELDVEYIKTILYEKDMSRIFNKFERMIVSGDEKRISSAFLMLYAAKNIAIDNQKEVIHHLILEFIQRIPYFEIHVGKRILLELYNIIKSDEFLQNENKDIVVKMFADSYEVYLNASIEHRKDALDGMYNISKLAKAYYDFLKGNNVEEGDMFRELIDKFKVNKLNEVKSIWG